ncbi:tail fiber assembly protein [Serratia sp. T13T92]|uniref:tail fiber assembly protein n=1 Tax=Serratia sp. T13T92 TaxID=3397496 RepID=UPI0039E161DF
MKLVNLQRYVPDVLFNGGGIQYFIDDTGLDWFKSMPFFTKKYSLAIENDTGVIRSISEDASRLYPVGLTVVDVDSLPDGCDILGGWLFDGEKVIPRIETHEEIVAKAQRNKERLLEIATKAMGPLQDAKDLGIATEDELMKLKDWMIHRVALSRINPENAPSSWPVAPDA